MLDTRPPFSPLLAFTLLLLAAPVPLAAQWAYAESSLRINVTPKNAAVYVDGYFAGSVDDFDGTFQRLHVAAGQHEITIYLAGFRSLKQRLYLSPNATRRIEGTLEALPPGEPPEPEPTPLLPPDPGGFPYANQPPPPFRGPHPPDQPPTPTQPNAPPVPQEPPAPGQSRFGTLSIEVQPASATLIIDGERWPGPAGDDRLIVQLPPGRHTIEAEREGYVRFVTEVEVVRDRTTPVIITLRRN